MDEVMDRVVETQDIQYNLLQKPVLLVTGNLVYTSSLALPDRFFSFIFGREKISHPNIKEKKRSGNARLVYKCEFVCRDGSRVPAQVRELKTTWSGK